MNNKIEQLAEHRALLVSKAADQRAGLAAAFAPLRVPLGYADHGLKAYRFLAHHPAVSAGVAALVIFIVPKHWFFGLDKGWLAWRMLHLGKRK